MCRFVFYKGRSIRVSDIFVHPDNSLLAQSNDGGFHPGIIDSDNIRNHKINGDGYGFAWYSFENFGKDLTNAWSCSQDIEVNHTTIQTLLESNPALSSDRYDAIFSPWQCAHLFRRTIAASQCEYLRNMSDMIVSPLVIGHVRAATIDSVSSENCHPFVVGIWSFVHNGSIPHFDKVKPYILKFIRKELLAHLHGSTDSEVFFLLILSLLPSLQSISHSVDDVVDTFSHAIALVRDMFEFLFGDSKGFSLNACITDGNIVVASRYRSLDSELPPSLYFQFGRSIFGNDVRIPDDISSSFDESSEVDDFIIQSAENGSPRDSDAGDEEKDDSGMSIVISSSPLSKNDEVVFISNSIISSRDALLENVSDKYGHFHDVSHCQDKCLLNRSSGLIEGNFNWEGFDYEKKSPWILIPKNHFLVSYSCSRWEAEANSRSRTIETLPLFEMSAVKSISLVPIDISKYSGSFLNSPHCNSNNC